MHERTHNELLTEKRGDTITTRCMRISSRKLGAAGQCDVLEFHRDNSGVQINGWNDRWQPFPVEYKRGTPKTGNCDEAQLCAQAMCLEEMLCCQIKNGALFYGETKHRTPVEFSSDLRNLVEESFNEMHALYQRGYTPLVKPTKSCNACSLKNICLPSLSRAGSAKEYILRAMEKMP